MAERPNVIPQPVDSMVERHLAHSLGRMVCGIAALFFQCGFAGSDVHFSVLSGADEDVGRAIVANLAWGTAREAVGHADEFARMYPSELSLARADAARAEVARTRDVFNDALASIGMGLFLADDEWFLPVATPITRRVRQSLERVTDALPELFSLDAVLSRRKRRPVNYPSRSHRNVHHRSVDRDIPQSAGAIELPDA